MEIAEDHRLTRIYTRSGDTGTTGLASGDRVSKNDIRIAAIGDIDELNCAIGVLRSHSLDNSSDKLLLKLQHLLFEVGAELALPDIPRILPADAKYLEEKIDELSLKLEPLRQFILPGGSTAACACHMARAICRRAERQLVALHNTCPLHADVLIFINRLSDLLFVLARYMNKSSQTTDIFWLASIKNS